MGVYKWKANKDRLVFINIIKEHILPQLAAIANEILQHFESHRQNSQSATILKRIIRIYYDLMVCDLPHFLREDSQLALWGQICLGVISLHIKPSDDEEEWIKTKKWAYRSINKLFNRYVRRGILDVTCNECIQIWQSSYFSVERWSMEELWQTLRQTLRTANLRSIPTTNISTCLEGSRFLRENHV